MSQNSAKDLLGPNIVSQEKLGRVSRNIDYEDNVKVFYSSGGSKQIGFTPQDLDVLRSGFEQTFREAGMIQKMWLSTGVLRRHTTYVQMVF